MTADDRKDTIREDLQATYSGAPKGPITDTMAKPLAKRFYKIATVSEAAPYQILLDGRAVKTPAKRPLVLPTRAAAEAVAHEWNAQGTEINPGTMPLTRFANTGSRCRCRYASRGCRRHCLLCWSRSVVLPRRGAV